MIDRRVRWPVLLAPLVLPWVWVSWATGSYTVFSMGWVDPGFHVVSVIGYVAHASLEVRNFTVAYPMGVGLYVLGLALAAWRSDSQSVTITVAILFFLAGLDVGFYALGIDGQSGITALPFGLIWLWAAAVLEYVEYNTAL